MSEFKYKEGDRVRIKSIDWWTDEMIEILAEDVLLDDYEELTDRAFKGGYEKCKSDIELNGFQLPDGYQFVNENGNEILASKIILKKKKKEYPNTYAECCKVLGVSEFEYNHTGTKMWYRHKLMATLDNLMLCRDAYWKIAGEEMGLDGPWEPDWNNEEQDKYGFHDEVKYTIINSAIFVFPTSKMRDAFKDNFNPDIEKCK